MVKVVVPERIDAGAAALERVEQLRVLRLVLAHDQELAPGCGLARTRHNLGEYVRRRAVENRLRRVQTEAVETELAYPVLGVLDEEVAHGARVLAVEIERVSPVAAVPGAEIAVGECIDKTADAGAVVVDHVENHTQPERVGGVDECAHVVGRAVEARRREKMKNVVAPPEAPAEFAHRHDLEDAHPELRKPRQLARRGRPRAFRRERADMHLVEDLPSPANAGPVRIAPGVAAGIDDFRRPVVSLRLVSRSGIRVEMHVVVEAQTVAHASRGVRTLAGKIPVAFSRQLELFEIVSCSSIREDDSDAPARRRPHAESRRSVLRNFRSDVKASCQA